MRKFEVLRCKQERTLKYYKKGRRDDGSVYSYAVFKTIKAGEKDLAGNVWLPGAYGHEGIKEGDIIELEGHLADKAATNPDLKEIKETPVKKKRGRPRKADAA